VRETHVVDGSRLSHEALFLPKRAHSRQRWAMQRYVGKLPKGTRPSQF
jgi:hypothetical protein